LYTEAIIVIGIVIVLFSVCSSALTVRRVKKQISEISDALEDIKNGNGNRRILICMTKRFRESRLDILPTLKMILEKYAYFLHLRMLPILQAKQLPYRVEAD